MRIRNRRSVRGTGSEPLRLVMKRPKVIIDGMAFESNSQLGIWRVFYETISRTTDRIDYTILLSAAPVQPLPANIRVRLENHRALPRRKFHVWQRIKHLKSCNRLRNIEEDSIWHSTFFSLSPNADLRSIVTIYDMIAERFFYYDAGLQAQKEFKLQAINAATSVVAISEATRADAFRFFPHLTDRSSVVTLGHEHLVCSDDRIPRNSQKNCLFVGARFSYKNFAIILEAMQSKEWPNHVDLDVVGTPFNAAELDYIRFCKLTDRVHHKGRLSDRELSNAYRSALCFIFPSLMEGFGLPVLEAQRNFCIPVLSDIPVFREVAGDGAIYFDSRSSSDLAQAVSHVSLRPQTSEFFGMFEANLAKFTWSNAADGIAFNYESLAMNNAATGKRK